MISERAALIGEKDYCDEAQILLQAYSKLKIVEFTEELDHLDKWVHNDTQPCLLITGEPHSGKKTLLYSFLKTQTSAHSNWLFIPHFGSVTPIYYNILYKTMVELRNHFSIEQRVDLNEEKLRRYFKYWLEVTSDFLQKEYLGYQKQEVPKVVIVIEGIDLCLDSKGNAVEPQFWLPSDIPPHIKIILTSRTDQTYFIGNCTVLRHQISQGKKDKIISKFNPSIKTILDSNKDLSLHCLYCINQMLTLKPKLNIKAKDFSGILSDYIACVSDSQLTVDVIKSLLFVLTLSRKGLRSRQLCKMVNLSIDKWDVFTHYFSFLMIGTGSYFIICQKLMKDIIGQLVDPTHEKAKTYRNSIVKSIKKDSIRLRDLEEIVFQLLMSQSYCQLKEVISRIQNFIMLYTPLSKELLCQCWLRLEQLQQFDPVYQYNKSIESYTSHYYPKEEELYKIIFQICMFFKEYSEFQNPKTPAFRHPLIKGEADSLQAIGIYEELKNLVMIGKCKVSKLKPIEKSDITWQGNYSKIESSETKFGGFNLRKTKASRVQLDIHQTPVENSSEKASERLIQEQIGDDDKQLINCSQESPIFNVEQLNVGILSNQQKFRQHFLGQMKEYLEDYFTPLKKGNSKERHLTFEAEDSENQEEIQNEKELRVDVEKLKGSFILKHYKEYLDQSYHKKGEQVQYYYYKQWIWLQFPWLCQTIKNVYSNMLKQCLPGSIHFMSPTRQFHLIRQVLKIARAAKQSKLCIYTHKNLQVLPIKLKVTKAGTESGVRTRREERLTQKSNTKSNTGQLFKKMTEQSSWLTKINKENIDQAILKEKIEESRLKEKTKSRGLKGQSSMPNLNLFMTETNEKETYMLPTLKKTKLGGDKTRRSQKQNHQDSRNYALLIRKYNEYKHQNDMLTEKIEQAKRIQQRQNNKSQEEIQALNRSIVDIQKKKMQIEKNHSNQMELRKKLEVIIKICDLNKMYGSSTDYLSSYLQNIKKMIECEESRVKEIKQVIQLSIEKGKITIKQLRNRKKELRAQKQMPTIPYNSICTDQTNMGITQMGIGQIEHELKQISRSTRQKSKKSKSVKDKHYLSYHDYEQLEQEIEIQYGQADNEEKIQDFADKFQKLKYIRMKIVEVERQQQEKQKRAQKLRGAFQTQWEGQARQKEIRIANQLVQKRNELANVKSRNLLLLQAMSTLKVQ